jgi:hypothetical protein
MTTPSAYAPLTIIQHRSCEAHRALLGRFWRVRPRLLSIQHSGPDNVKRSPVKAAIHGMPHEERSRMIADLRRQGGAS